MINNNTYYDDVLIRFLESTINNRGQTYTIGTTGDRPTQLTERYSFESSV